MSEQGHLQLFHLAQVKNDPLLPFATFLKYSFSNRSHIFRLLSKEDEMVQLLSGKILVYLIAYVHLWHF